jgi:hypothetical protein
MPEILLFLPMLICQRGAKKWLAKFVVKLQVDV